MRLVYLVTALWGLTGSAHAQSAAAASGAAGIDPALFGRHPKGGPVDPTSLQNLLSMVPSSGQRGRGLPR